MLTLLEKQRQALLKKQEACTLQPLSSYDTATGKLKGEVGNVGCIILSGGQGTRMASPEAKALLPVSVVRKKCLLQLFCEKREAASKKVGFRLPLAIMTSPLNHEKISSYLQKHHWENVDLFSQEMLPFLNDQGNWFFEAPGKIAQGPDGNGYALKLFYRSGLWEKWKKAGIEAVNIVQIDNPLADPYDAELAAYHFEQKADVTIKAAFRESPSEKVGAIGLQNGKVAIVEYSELENAAPFTVANIGLFCMSMKFIEKIASITLPWHLARKNDAWKFETFIFDLLNYADKVKVLVYPREEVYSPLKNASGEKSLQTVQASLLAEERKILEKLSGASLSNRVIELDAAFHYPTPELLQKWKGKQLPEQDYIDAEV